jgi:hypothetical protein
LTLLLTLHYDRVNKVDGLTPIDIPCQHKSPALFCLEVERCVCLFFWHLGFWQVTAKKIRLFTTRDTWEPVLRELIDPSELPLEYGGTGPNRLREYLEQGRKRAPFAAVR